MTAESYALAEGDDEFLMVRFAAGHLEAFDELYRRYEAPLYGFCVRLVGDADRADDVFQDAMMKVLEQRGAYRPTGRFRSWLFTITRNLCLDRIRSDQRQRRLLELHAVSATPPRHPGSDVEARDALSALLAALPTDQREVLLLHRYHGFSYMEIAAMTDSSEAAVKQKAYRALLTLRRRRD